MRSVQITRRQALRSVALGASTALMSAAIAACGGGAAPASPAAAPTQATGSAPPTTAPAAAPTTASAAAPTAAAAPTTAPAAQPTAAAKTSGAGEIRLLTTHGPSLQTVIKTSLANFQKANPTVKVSWEDLVANYYDKIGTMAAGGTLPDVVNLRSFDMYDWYRKKALYDVTNLMKQENLTPDKYVATIGSCLQEGKYWGLPYDASVDIIFYNKDLFDKSGVKYPDKSWTWDKLLEAAKALTKTSGADTTQYGFAAMPPIGDWQAEAFLLQSGARFVSDDRTKFLPTTAEAVSTLQWWTDLVTKYKVAPTPASNSSVDLFSVGKGAMNIAGQWQIPTYRQGLKFAWDSAWLSAGPKGQQLETQGGTYIISSKTKVPDASWAMLKWITSEPDWQQNVYGVPGYSVPAWKEVDDSFVAPTKPPKSQPPSNAQVVLDELATASTGEVWPNYWNALKAWTDQVNLVLLGKATPDQAVKAAQDGANKIIQDALTNG